MHVRQLSTYVSPFLIVIGIFVSLCEKKKRVTRLCFLWLLPLLSKKSSASYCLKDFFFKTRASSSSLAVSLIFSFRQNVELLLSTSGYAAPVFRSCIGDKGIKVCCSKPRDEKQLFRKMLLAIKPLFGVVECIA